jgi:hypothetical protein
VFWLLAFPVLLYSPLWIGWLQGDPMIVFSGLGTKVGGHPLPGLPTIDPNVAFTSQALGIRAAHDWLSGHVPWWNPFEATGVPLAGEMQSAALFLPWILFLALPSGQLWFHCSLEIVAGLGAFLLLRELGVGLLAATVGGLLFEVNGTFAWLANAVVNPVAFLPWLLFGIERVYRDQGGVECRAIPGGAIIVLAVAFSLYAGFPEVAYLNGLLGVVWAGLRFVQLRSRARWRFAGWLLLGGGLGLLLAFPVVLPFLDYLQYAFVGGHNAGFAYAHLAHFGIASVVFPYFFGPLGVNWNFSSLGYWWGSVGGYFGIGLLLAAILGLTGRRERALRLILGCWVVIGVLKTFGQPEATRIVNIIPMIRDVAFMRYIWPSWEMALVILSALALEDLRSGSVPRNRAITAWLTGGVVVALMGATGGSLAGKLLVHPGYAPWILAVLLLGITVFIVWGIGMLCESRGRVQWLAGLILAEAMLFFMLPIFSNPRHGKVALGGVQYLQSHLGLQRFYTLGPIQPNYGSAFGLAELNYNDLPIAKSAAQYVHDRLDPYADQIIFNGNFPRPKGVPSSADELRARLAAYEAAGVAYVVTTSGENPFLRLYSTKVIPRGNRPAPLFAGQSLSLEIRGIPDGWINAIAVFIGTYSGKSNGPLSTRVCTGGVCVHGSRALSEARDNAYFRIPLATPLSVGAAAVDITFTHSTGNQPLAIWIWPLASGAKQSLTRPKRAGVGVRMNLEYRTAYPSGAPKRVYWDSVLNIFRLPHPTPYFRALGCRVAAESRLLATFECTNSSRLIRLETALPGWHATVDGMPVKIQGADGLFQSVTLPAGQGTVRFRYTPQHLGLILSGFWVGGIGLLIWITAPGIRQWMSAQA